MSNHSDEKMEKILGLSYRTFYTCGLYYKSFTILIYDRNDSTIVWPVL